jgi:hypothetical protein
MTRLMTVLTATCSRVCASDYPIIVYYNRVLK